METVRYPELARILSRSVGPRSEQEIADWCGVSQAAVSKWLSGQTRPQSLYLAILVTRLKLDPYQLAKAAERKPEDILRLRDDVLCSPRDLELARHYIRNLYKTRVRGDSSLAIEMADDLIAWIETSSNPSQELARIHAQALVEKLRAYAEVTPRDRIWYVSYPIIKKIEELAEVYENDEIWGLAGTCRGDTYYVVRAWEKAAHQLTSVLESGLLKITDDHLWLLRSLILSSAYLKDLKTFQKAEKTARSIIDQGQFRDLEHVIHLLEGCGRSQGLFGHPTQAFDALDEGQNFYQMTIRGKEKAPMRAVQLVRSRLIVIEQSKPTDHKFLEKEGKKGLEMAREYGYERHAHDIQELLDKALN